MIILMLLAILAVLLLGADTFIELLMLGFRLGVAAVGFGGLLLFVLWLNT